MDLRNLRGLELDVPRIIDLLGLDRIVEAAGKGKLIQKIGLKEVIEMEGEEKVIEMIGLEKALGIVLRRFSREQIEEILEKNTQEKNTQGN